MKGTEEFKNVIKAHLDSVAQNDELFAKTYAKENKNLDECIDYIFAEVKKSGKAGFADSEIFKMAVHYYDEDNIKPGKFSENGKVVVNRSIELSEAEIEEAKQKALQEVIDKEKKRLTSKPKTKAKEEVVQTSLF